MARRKVYIVAHGETQVDKEGRVHGHLDPPLTLSGILAGKRNARKLKGKGIERIYSSPRLRARQTAALLAKALGVPVEVRDELVPWDLGRISGAKAASIRPLIDFFSSRPTRAIPSGEPKAAVLTRYRKFISGLKRGKNPISGLKRGKNPVAISGHSQHTLGFDYASKGGDLSKVKMIGGKAGEVKEVLL